MTSGVPKGGPMSYKLRVSNVLYTGTWKVTARFSVQFKPGVFIKCVRLRHGVAPVKHFTEEELDLHFQPLEAS